MSLKEGLKKIIANYNGATFTYGEFEEFCKRNGRRVSNGERRIRELVVERDSRDEPIINVIRSRKGIIVGWAWNVPRYPSQEKLGFMRGVL